MLWPQAQANFDLNKGEILGLYGLVGAGRSELAQALFGVDPSPRGEVILNGTSIKRGSIKDSIRSGIYLAPEDRKSSSLVLKMSIRENMTLNSLRAYSQFGKIDVQKEKINCQTWLDEYGVKAENIEVPPSTLSGGNQQKVVLSKWMTQNPVVMIFDEPTRGIDIGARHEIYESICDLASQGCGVLMISSDMEELMGMSHRILVMKNGHTVGSLEKENFSESSLMKIIMNNSNSNREIF
jgi:ribose transport system ATP-binding protein